MNPLDYLEKVPSILNYGIIGLGFIVCAFGFVLMWREGNKKLPRKMMLFGIALFMSVGGILVVGTGIIESQKSFTGMIESSYKSMGTQRSKEAFMDGTSAGFLDGTWRVRWYQYDQNTKKMEPYTFKDPETGEMVPYADDIVKISSDGPHIWSESFNTNTNTSYWLEGRISIKEYITLIYWSRLKPIENAFTGVVFLALAGEVAGKLRLKGTWRGFSRKKEVIHGEVVWRQVEKAR